MEKSYYLMLFIALFIVTSCGTSDSSDSTQTELEAIVSAPATATVGTLVEIDGSESTGPITVYGWLMVSQPQNSSARVEDTESEITSFTPDLAGEYTIRLVLISDRVLSDSDEVTISVTDN